jgi:nuclear pore complex protein Nup85
MYSCGNVGKSRADEILLRVPLKLQEQNSDRQINSRIRAGDVVGVLKDVNKTCFQYKRENVRRTVCRVYITVDLNLQLLKVCLDCCPNTSF